MSNPFKAAAEFTCSRPHRCEVAHFKMNLEMTQDGKTQDTREEDARRVASR